VPAPELARRLPRILVGIALALPVLLVVGVLAASQVLQRDPAEGPGTVRLSLPEVPVPAASSADCARLLSGLPQEIRTGEGLLPRRLLTAPVPAGTVAWGGREDEAGRPVDPPVVLHCGLPRPPELGPTSSLLDVDGVEWVERREPDGGSTWITADRAIYVGLTLPDGAGSAAIQDVSRGVKITLASRPPDG
jgi:hypothetical protein